MTTTLVLGGNGKTGSRVAARLRELGRPVRIGSRKGDPRFDWADDATWPPALRDVESTYISYYPDVSFPGAAERVGAFAKTAVTSGARRLVLLITGPEKLAALQDAAPQSPVAALLSACGAKLDMLWAA